MALSLLIALALALILLGASLFFASQVIYPKTQGLEATYRIEVDKGLIDEAVWASWEKREVSIASPFGYQMGGLYLPLEASSKTVIIVHGVTYTHFGSVKYVEAFRARGYNALLIDLRRHGATGGPNTTFGYYEKRDMVAWTDWALAELGPGGRVGSHGESMGAAIVLEHAGIDPRLSFVVADCAFSDLARLLAFRLKEDFRLPAFPLVALSGLVCRLLTGMSYAEVKPLADAMRIQAPLLFIHGEADTYILPSMSREMHEVRLRRGLPSRIHFAPGAGHAGSYASNPAEYRNLIDGFLASFVS